MHGTRSIRAAERSSRGSPVRAVTARPTYGHQKATFKVVRARGRCRSSTSHHTEGSRGTRPAAADAGPVHRCRMLLCSPRTYTPPLSGKLMKLDPPTASWAGDGSNRRSRGGRHTPVIWNGCFRNVPKRHRAHRIGLLPRCKGDGGLGMSCANLNTYSTRRCQSATSNWS